MKKFRFIHALNCLKPGEALFIKKTTSSKLFIGSDETNKREWTIRGKLYREDYWDFDTYAYYTYWDEKKYCIKWEYFDSRLFFKWIDKVVEFLNWNLD